MKLALEDIAKLGDQTALICVDQNCSSMANMEASRSGIQNQRTAETKLGTELLLNTERRDQTGCTPTL